MGEIADSLINGECCHYCGTYLEPSEPVYLVHSDTKTKVEMPEDGSAFGVPVYCIHCDED